MVERRWNGSIILFKVKHKYGLLQCNAIQTIQYIMFHNFLAPEQGILSGFFHSRTGW